MNSRRHFTKETQRAAIARSGGICECHLMPHIFAEPCGRQLGDGNTFYEHVDADRSNNALNNCACLTKTCWKFKSDKYDQPVIAKVRRVSDLAKGIKDPHRRRLPGGRDSDVRITIGCGTVDRRTGLPWRGAQ